MANAPPTNFPAPPSGGPAVAFPASPTASVCGLSLGLPKFSFGFQLPSLSFFAFPPPIPIPFIAFKFSCNLSDPVDVTAGLKLPFGGGRPTNAPPDPDNQENFP